MTALGLSPLDLDGPGDARPRPHGNTYWLVPGRVLCGEHPGYAGEQTLPQRLQAFRAAGIGCFVDLTQPGDPVPAYVPLPWDSARGPRPARHVRHPVPDFGLPSVAGMRAALETVRMALASGERVYVHCRAGIGRTGTLAGCLLVEAGLDGEAALACLQLKWAVMDKRHDEPHTPETAEQRAFIRAWSPM